MALFVGLMSGTSLDGVDGVLVDLDDTRLDVRAHLHRPFPEALCRELLALNQPGDNELHRAALAANGVAETYAEVVAALGAKAGDVRAIGAHGQTVRHQPGQFDGTGYTVQLLNGALLAERAGINVVCDFRSPRRGRRRPGGAAGARLPRRLRLARYLTQDIAVLNIGGIANLTLIPARRRRCSVSTPAQATLLMDALDPGAASGACHLMRVAYWAARGRVDADAGWHSLLVRSLTSPPRRPRAPAGTCSMRPGWRAT